MRNCVFAGSFDPITVGHASVVEKCLKIFDRVFVVIGKNPNKRRFFTEEERLKLTEAAFKDNQRVTVSLFSRHENYAEYLKQNEAYCYVRGIRNGKDFEYELAAEKINEKLYKDVVTVYLSADEKFKDISSSKVREIFSDGGDYLQYIPTSARNCAQELFNSKWLKKQ